MLELLYFLPPAIFLMEKNSGRKKYTIENAGKSSSNYFLLPAGDALHFFP